MTEMEIDTSAKATKRLVSELRSGSHETYRAANLLEALASERNRAEHITKVTQRSRRFSSEQ